MFFSMENKCLSSGSEGAKERLVYPYSLYSIHIPYTHIPYSMGGQLELQIEFPNHLMVADDVSAGLH